MTANEIKITASFTFRGQTFTDVEVINPGDWFGKTWLMEIGGSYSSFFVVVEADSLTDAIDELIDSKYGRQFILDEADYTDYGVGTDEPTCYFGGNNGHPCCIDDLLIHGDDRTGFQCLYNVEGWDVLVKPTDLASVQEKLELRAECEADVKRPGKMEGNASYVPYFWDHYLDGGADDDERGVLRFNVTHEDRLIFPDLNGVDSVYLYESEQGFVNDLGRPAEEDEYFGNDEETEDEDSDTSEPMYGFTVIEYLSFYAVRHNPTGEEVAMGDGVDTVFDHDGTPCVPGTEHFRVCWEISLNVCASETLEAYFPHLADDDEA